MRFIYYDLAIFAIFCAFVIFFLYAKRKKVEREGILFLYRTQAGIKKIDYLNKKFHSFWKKLGPVIIVAGFVFMALIFILLIQSIFFTFKVPTKVPPIMPLVPYLPQAFNIPMPPFYFTYWIIIIAIIAITHEFAHGIYARLHKIKIKSTGFGFLGPFLVAFVEPDEKIMAKKKNRAQLEILAAGSFSNFVFAIIFVLLMQLFFVVAYEPAGIAYSLAYSTINLSEIKSIDNYSAQEFLNLSDNELKAINTTLEVKTENASYWLTPELIKSIPFLKKTIAKQQLIVVYDDSPAFRANLSGGIIAINGKKMKNQNEIAKAIKEMKAGDEIEIETTQNVYKITLSQSKEDSEKGYLGIALVSSQKGLRAFISSLTTPFFSPHIFVKPKYNAQVLEFFVNLFIWLILICFFVALFNMLPVGFLDGGKFIYLSSLALTKSKKKANIIFKITSYLVGIIFVILIFAWLLA